MITEANTDDQRRQVERLFEATIPDIDANSVPRIQMDQVYAPTVAQYHDPETGVLAGAALVCRAQIVAAALQMGNPSWNHVLDKHRELDLMAVLPKYRGRGIGTQLLNYLIDKLGGGEVRVLFGNITPHLDVDQLREFYGRHGFTVLDPGVPLPPLLGSAWGPPVPEPGVSYFYQRLRRPKA